MLEIIDADFNDPDHGRQVLAMLNEYASGPMGGNTPLPAHAQANLIPELACRPTVRALLARIDGQAAGVAIYVEGFSTFACRPLLNLHDLAVSPRFQGQGVGKALLLDAEEPQWKALHRIGSPVSSRAPGGRQTWEAFRDRMREYAAQGYAFDLEDNEPSIRCVAAPVRDASSGIVAAISVSSTVPYMSLERMREMVAVVQGAAAGISAELGWKVERA